MSPKRLLFCLALLLGVFVGSAHAQRVVSDDEVNAIAKELYCPVCESTPLDVCPTQACADWRELIRTQLAEGKSRQEILDYFSNQYGDGVLAEPPRRGFALFLWIFPVVALLVGGGFLIRFLRQARLVETATTAVAPTPVGDAHSPLSLTTAEPAADYLAQIEQEVAQR